MLFSLVLTWSTKFPAVKQSFIHNSSFCMWFLDVLDTKSKRLRGWPSTNGGDFHLVEASGAMEFTAATDSCLTAQIHQMLRFCYFMVGLSNPQCSEDQRKKETLHIKLFGFFGSLPLQYCCWFYSLHHSSALSSRQKGGTLLWQAL